MLPSTLADLAFINGDAERALGGIFRSTKDIKEARRCPLHTLALSLSISLSVLRPMRSFRKNS